MGHSDKRLGQTGSLALRLSSISNLLPPLSFLSPFYRERHASSSRFFCFMTGIRRTRNSGQRGSIRIQHTVQLLLLAQNQQLLAKTVLFFFFLLDISSPPPPLSDTLHNGLEEKRSRSGCIAGPTEREKSRTNFAHSTPLIIKKKKFLLFDAHSQKGATNLVHIKFQMNFETS